MILNQPDWILNHADTRQLFSTASLAGAGSGQCSLCIANCAHESESAPPQQFDLPLQPHSAVAAAEQQERLDPERRRWPGRRPSQVRTDWRGDRPRL